MMMTLIPGNFVFGEESAPENDYLGVARKSQYVLYASSKENGIQLNGKNYVINGNVHANSDIAAYLDKLDVRGKLETTGKVINYNNGVTQYIKKENAPERVLIDPSAYITDSLGANAKVYENWTSLSDSTLENTEPIQAKSGLQFSASVIKLKNTIMSNGSMLVNASETFVSPENEEVLLYSANGDIQVSAQNVEINGIIYAPNGTVQISGTNIKINGMIIAKKIQIGADNKLIINQNLNLKNAPAFKYYNDELQVYSEAETDDTTDNINVNWENKFDEGKFDVYSSTDNKNFTLLGTVTVANTYAYATNGSTNDIYFKVKQTLNNGFTKESNTVKMVYDVYKCQYVFEDTDADGEKLTDTYEFFLETDMNNVDTDGDDLTDYAEIFLTGTDPLYKDSDEDGVLDCDEDTDGDTLTNKYEIKLGTDPQKVDTDEDTLADNYEVAGIKIKGDDTNTYKTLPTNADTDGDTISDSDEALLGLNPLNPDTDGDGILDCDEMFKQKVEPLEIKNPNSAVTQVDLDINIAGNAEKNVEMESVMGKDTYSSAVVGLIGEPIRIEAKSKFDTATLTFKIDKNKLGSNIDFNDIQMMWYNEDTGFYEYYNTVHNSTNYTVSTNIATTTRNAKIMRFAPSAQSTQDTKSITIVLTDKDAWEKYWKSNLYAGHETTTATPNQYNTIIAVDCTESVDGVDQQTEEPYNTTGGTGDFSKVYTSKRADFLHNYLSHIYKDEYVSVRLFNDILDDESSYKHNYSSTYSVHSYFNRVDDMTYGYGEMDYNNVLLQLISQIRQNRPVYEDSIESTNKNMKVINNIILVTDGYGTLNMNTIKLATDNGIGVKVFLLLSGNENSGLEALNVNNDYTKGMCSFDVITDDSGIINEYSEFSYHKYLDTTTNSDTDTIPDCFEKYGMKCGNKLIYSDPNTAHSDKDGLSDSQEIQMITQYEFDSAPEYIRRLSPNRYIFKMISNPMKEDSDDDGWWDYAEQVAGTNPLLNDTDLDGIKDSDDVEPLTPNELRSSYGWSTVKYNKSNGKLQYDSSKLKQSKKDLQGIEKRCLENILVEDSTDFSNNVESNGLINNQSYPPFSDMKYGEKYTMGDNGCELIGVYNALKLNNKNQMLSETAMEFELNKAMMFGKNTLETFPEWKISGLASFFSYYIYINFKSGRFGSNPYAINAYLNAHKHMHFVTDSLSRLESWTKPGRVFIISCWNNKNKITDGLHTFAVVVNADGTISSYNGYYNNRFYTSFSDILEKKHSLICAYYII